MNCPHTTGELVTPVEGRYLHAFHRIGIIIGINKRGFPNHRWWKFHVLWCEGVSSWVSFNDIAPAGEDNDGREVRNRGSSGNTEGIGTVVGFNEKGEGGRHFVHILVGGRLIVHGAWSDGFRKLVKPQRGIQG